MAESKNQLQQILDDILQDKNTNLTPDNLKQGVTCLGIKGNLQEGIDTSDATAIASDISNGKTAYVNKKKITGTLIDNNGQITLDNQDDITAKTGSDYLDVHTNIGTDTIVRANNPISIRPSFEKTAEAIGLTADKVIEGNTILGIEGTGRTSEDLQEQLNNQDLIIQQLQEELSNKAIYDCNYYNAKLVPTNGSIKSYITEISVQLDTSKVTNMDSMFSSCTNLTTIPLLDTSNVTSMEFMFNKCTNLTTIPLLDTSKVTSMYCMFYECTNLTTIPLLDTSKVTNMFYMFYSCTSLTTIPLLDTSSVTSMTYMFRNCRNLTTISLLDMSKVTSIQDMFDGCTSLSDESLNNILAMCANAVKITNSSYKTLKYIGLTSAQANKCKTLSNYSAFTSAGWTTGY